MVINKKLDQSFVLRSIQNYRLVFCYCTNVVAISLKLHCVWKFNRLGYFCSSCHLNRLGTLNEMLQNVAHWKIGCWFPTWGWLSLCCLVSITLKFSYLRYDMYALLSLSSRTFYVLTKFHSKNHRAKSKSIRRKLVLYLMVALWIFLHLLGNIQLYGINVCVPIWYYGTLALLRLELNKFWQESFENSVVTFWGEW